MSRLYLFDEAVCSFMTFEFKGLRFRFLAPSKKKEKTRNKFEFNYSQDSCFWDFGINPFGVTNDDVIDSRISRIELSLSFVKFRIIRFFEN